MVRYSANSNINLILVCSLSFILSVTNSFTIPQTFKSKPLYKTRATTPHYATIDQSSIEEAISATKERKLTKTDELNRQLSKLYHDIQDNGNISQVYDMEHIIFSYNNNSDSVILDTVSYNTLLSAWKNMAVRYEEGNVTGTIPKDILPKNHVYVAMDVALRSNKILQYMEDKNLADLTSYNIVMDTWAKSKSNDGGIEVEKILKRILSSDTITPDVISFNCILDACSNMDIPNVEDKVEEMYSVMLAMEIQPTSRTYNLLINAYTKSISNHLEVGRSTSSNSDTEKSLEKQQILKRQHDNSVMETRHVQKKAEKRVLELVQEIKDNEGDLTSNTYTHAIDCLARCCLPHRCEVLLQELEELFQAKKEEFVKEHGEEEAYSSDVLATSPTIRTYTALINAWSWSKSLESGYKALAILSKVEELYESSLQNKQFDDSFCNTIKPNVRTYTSVISCIAHSRIEDKAVIALDVLKRLITKYTQRNDVAFRPNIFTYNAVIDTCSKVYASNCKNPQVDGGKMQSDALKIAFDVFKLIRKDKSVKANYVTYGTLLKATKNLLPIGEERSNIIKVLFQRCCKEGHVDTSVLKQLRQTVSIDMYKELLGEDIFDLNGGVHFDKLPKAWSANVGS